MHYQTPRALISRMSSLDDPALCENNKSVVISALRKKVLLARFGPTTDMAIRWMTHDVDTDVMAQRNCLCTTTCITRINMQHLQCWIFRHRLSHDRVRSVAVLNIGGSDAHCQQQSQHIYHEVALWHEDAHRCGRHTGTHPQY